jgi:hypothetical protein
VSTIKSVETFGTPPPLPPVHGSPDGRWNLDMILPESMGGVVADPDALASSHVHLLKRQSVRWLNLSTTLWSLAVLDVYRPVTIESVASFFEMVSWRAHDKVTAEEFSVLYSEWVAKPEKMPTSSQNRRVAVGVFGVRQLLLEKKYGEADLDLCIGIIVNEINMRLLNSSVSYVNRKPGSNTQNPFSLEVCTERWLSLCDELFFTLDTPGYGVLRFDEAFFYCACVTTGMQGWDHEDELEADLSLATLTAATLQFLSDTGAHVALRSGHQHDIDLSWAIDSGSSLRGSRRGQQTQSASQTLHNSARSSGGGKCEVTLAMFKRYFLKRSVGEASLAALLAHVQGCVERVARLASVSGAEDLYQACRPYETELGTLGSPRLWQQAVLIASGHVYQPLTAEASRGARSAEGAGNSGSGGGSVPPIILFLLSDADRLLSGALRANELPTDGTGFIASASAAGGRTESPTAANEELHECVYRIWNHFRRWGSDSTGNNTAANSGSAAVQSARPVWGSGTLHNPGSFYGATASQADLADVQRDPLYQLVLTAVLQYKSLQQLLLAALFDVTLTQCGVGGSSAAQAGNVGPLVVICAGLVPNPQRLLVELGFADERSSWNDADTGNVTGMRSPTSPTNARRPQAVMTSIDSPVVLSPAESAPSKAQSSSPLPVPPPRRRRPAPVGTQESDSDLYSHAQAPIEGAQLSPSASRLSAETARSAAKKRASQRIQEQRAADGLAQSSAAEASSVEDEVAQAKWSPLFTSHKATPPARAGNSNNQAKRHDTVQNLNAAGFSEVKAAPRPSAASTAAPTPSAAATGVTASTARRSGPTPAQAAAHSLSDEEAVLLSEILDTSDVGRQNDLIARMKRLRVSENAPSTVKAAPEPGAAEEGPGSGSEAGAFGQFQKLEESVLFLYDKQLAGAASNQEGSAAGEDGDAPHSNAAPSDAASLGPSSVCYAVWTIASTF